MTALLAAEPYGPMSAQSVKGGVELRIGGRYPSGGVARRSSGQGEAEEAWSRGQWAPVALVVAHADAAGSIAARPATSGSAGPRPVQ